MSGLRIAFFGSSLLSAYWNGAATYYRGIVRALHELGHHVTFLEPDAFDRQRHRDLEPPPWAEVVVWPAESEDDAARALERTRDADVVVKASGLGVHDAFLEREVLAARRPGQAVLFWDVDAPATLDRLEHDPADPFRALVPRFDLVLTYGGGVPVVSRYEALGARRCIPIYNAVDPDVHRPAPRDPRFDGLLGFLGNRLPDREARVREFFLGPAAKLAPARCVLGGNGWQEGFEPPGNVAVLGHVFTRDHNAFNCSVDAVLNVSRDSMARCGHSPATRFFEALGAGACLVTDAWEGVEAFAEPGAEVLVARDGEEVARQVLRLKDEPGAARRIGAAGRARVLAEHTYRHRAKLLAESLGAAAPAGRAGAVVPRMRSA